jgi:hypothetical protein
LWRTAPYAAAFCLLVAVVGRSMNWPAAVPVALLGVGLTALGVYVAVHGRARPLSDHTAAIIDADARCGGELRSASWFATRQNADSWTELHLNRAADHLEAIDWSDLYPPVRAVPAWISTAVLILATLTAAFMLPERNTARANTPAQSNPASVPANLDGLPPELLAQLAELLAAADAGTLAAERTSISSAELRELIAGLGKLQDREALKELAKRLESNQRAASDQSSEQMKTLAARAKHAAESKAASREFREAMEDLSRNLTDAAAEEALTEDQDGAVTSSERPQPGEGGAASAAAIDEAMIQSVKEAAPSAAGSGMIAMSNDAATAAATPGFGVGGSGSSAGEARPTDLARALRQEIVEASTDTAGANVNAPVRRKTEEGHATAAFTRTASGRSDRSRAAAPPEVPESRRIDVQRYFTRQQ